MKQLCAYALTLMGCLSSFSLHAAIPFIHFRSQSVNGARELVGQQSYMNKTDTNSIYSCFSCTPEYTSSFKGERLASCLFGPDVHCNTSCGSSITISGSRVAGRNATDWLADYFGLPTDYQSTLVCNPHITNLLADFNWYVGINSTLPGFFFRIHAPVVHTRASLHAQEVNIIAGSAPYEPGYFNAGQQTTGGNPVGVPRSNLLANALQFFTGNVPNLAPDVTFQPLRYGKFACKKACNATTHTALSDIECAFGKNFWCDPDYLFGISARWSIPTGNKPHGVYVLEPIVGSGGFWKVGLGVNGQATLWRNETEHRSFGVYLDAHINHYIPTTQCRTFDLCGKPGSRYMLAQKLGTTRQTPQLIGASDAGVEFQNEFTSVANLTTTPIKVAIALEGDVVLKFGYYACNWNCDIGYNFWGRSCEKLSHPCYAPGTLDGATWALKGDANVIGFAATSSSTPVRLAAIQTDATINSGTNNYIDANGNDGGINGIRPTANPGITAPQVLIGINGSTGNINVNDRTPAAGNIPTRSSNPVVFLQPSDVDLVGSQGISHKIFTHFSHQWTYDNGYTPFLGFGMEVEFARKNSCSSSCQTANPSCTPTECELFSPLKAQQHCQQCALSQWGVWVKAGIAC